MHHRNTPAYRVLRLCNPRGDGESFYKHAYIRYILWTYSTCVTTDPPREITGESSPVKSACAVNIIALSLSLSRSRSRSFSLSLSVSLFLSLSPSPAVIFTIRFAIAYRARLLERESFARRRANISISWVSTLISILDPPPLSSPLRTRLKTISDRKYLFLEISFVHDFEDEI